LKYTQNKNRFGRLDTQNSDIRGTGDY